MRKFLTALLTLLTVLCISFGVSACKEVQDSSSVDSATVQTVEYVSGLSENVYVGLLPSLKDLQIKVTYSNGEVEEIAYSNDNKADFKVEGDTSELGESIVTISYKGVSFEYVVEVIFSVDSVTMPEFVNLYNAQKGESSNFTDKTQGYVVGDDNAFYFSPVVTAYVGEELVVFDEPGEVEIVAKLFLKNGDNFEEIADTASYAEINLKNASFDFVESAVGSTFKIAVYPAVLTDEEEITHFTKEFEFAVVDGYNVYSVEELLLWDNRAGKTPLQNDVNNRTYGEAIKKFREEKGVTVNADDVNGLVLHTNLVLSTDNLPDCYFYDEEKDSSAFTGLSAEKKELLQGSLKDYSEIMSRMLKENGTFNFEGNYFTIDASALPFITQESGNPTMTIAPTSVVSHAKMLVVEGLSSVDGTTNTENFTIKNANFTGNCNRQENSYSGGIILLDAKRAKGEVNNVIAKRYYTALFVEMNATGHEVSLNGSVLEDSYNTLVYLWGGFLNVNNSRIYGAGGPAILADHCYSTSTTSGRTGTKGWTSNVVVDKDSTVASYVTGQEGWFAQYGATSTVSSFITLDQALFKSFGKTFTTVKADEAGNSQTLINLAIVFKSGDAEGMTFNPISGKATIGEHKLDFDGAYTSPFLAGFAGTGAPIFQSTTEAGIIAYAGQNPQSPQLPVLYNLAGAQTLTPLDIMAGEILTQPLFAQDEGYLNIFVGSANSAGYMGVILGDFVKLA